MDAKKIEKISKALADPNRLAILKELRKNKNCLYCSDVSNFVDLTQPSISHHLKLLSDAELIIPSKEGRNMRYTLNNKIIDQYVTFLQALKS
jgi:ArsR family transcriptional regulator